MTYTYKRAIEFVVLAGDLGNEFSLNDLADHVGCTYSRAREVVQELIERGEVEQTRRGVYAPLKALKVVNLTPAIKRERVRELEPTG